MAYASKQAENGDPGERVAGGALAITSFPDDHQRHQVDSLFRAHEVFFRRLASRLCGSMLDSEDLIQDVLERMVRNAAALGAVVDHRAWMVRMTRNLFIDRVRRHATTPESAPLEHEVAVSPAESPAWWEGIDVDHVRVAVGKLPDDLRETFELFTFHRWSYAAIAAHLAILRATVGTRILRARGRLRQLLVALHGSVGAATRLRARAARVARAVGRRRRSWPAERSVASRDGAPDVAGVPEPSQPRWFGTAVRVALIISEYRPATAFWRSEIAVRRCDRFHRKGIP